jgi:hypothetical protein
MPRPPYPREIDPVLDIHKFCAQKVEFLILNVEIRIITPGLQRVKFFAVQEMKTWEK